MCIHHCASTTLQSYFAGWVPSRFYVYISHVRARECDGESCEGTRVRKRDKERWNKTDETERGELVEVHRVSKLLLCPHLWILLKIESIFTQQK